MEAGIPRIRAACFVPAVQYLCAFGGRQYVKLSQFTARIDLPPTNRASRSLVKFVFGEEDEHEE
ncbi:hypothetical protein, partial [Burkholderia mallei]